MQTMVSVSALAGPGVPLRAASLPPEPQPCTGGQLPTTAGLTAWLQTGPDCLTDMTTPTPDNGDGFQVPNWAPPPPPSVGSGLTVSASTSAVKFNSPFTLTSATGRTECPTSHDAVPGCWSGDTLTVRMLPDTTNGIVTLNSCDVTVLTCQVTVSYHQALGPPPPGTWIVLGSQIGVFSGPSQYGTAETTEIALPLAGPGPSAAFTVASQGKGDYQFTSTSTDPGQTITATDWNFGDGAKGTGTVASHTYTKPGNYTVTLAVTDSKGGTGQTTQQLTVVAPPLGVSIFVPTKLASSSSTPSNPVPGDLLQADIDVSAGDGVGDLSNLTFSGSSILQITPTGGLVIVGGSGAPPPAITLAPNTDQVFPVQIQAAQVGVATLSTTVTGQDAAGAGVQATAQQTVQVGTGLTVTISYVPSPLQIQLNSKRQPIPQPFAVTVKVTNPFPSTVDAVTLGKNPILTLMGEDIAVPVAADTTKPQPALNLGSLQPGQSAQAVFPFLATTDGQATIAWTVTGTNPATGGAIKGSGVDVATVAPAQLVAIDLSTNGASNQSVTSGSVATINGVLTNLTNAQVVNVNPIVPILTGNSGGANPTDATKSPPPGAYPLPVSPTLQPGQVISLTADAQTVQSQGTRATVNYVLDGTVTLADGTTRGLAPNDAEYSPVPTDGSDGAQEVIHINDSAPPPPAASDFTSGVAQFSIGFAKGGYQWLASTFSTVAWLVKSTPGAIATVAGAPIQFLQAVDYEVTYWAYLTPSARDVWYTQLAQDVLAQTTAMGKSVAAVKAAIDLAVTAWFTQLSTAWYAGDYNTVLNLTGQVSGNIALEVASWSIKLPEAATLVKLGDAAKQSGVAKRVASGLQALKAGDDLAQTPGALARLFGITPAQVAALRELAVDKGLLIAARQRNPLSIAWEATGAVLKPEAIKIKTVSDIDVTFLGYRPGGVGVGDEGSVVFKKPITTQQLQSSAAYQSASPVEQQAAMAQLQLRTQEWTDDYVQYFAMNKPLSQGGGISTTFDYIVNGATAPGNTGVSVKQAFALTPVPAQGPGYYVVTIGGHRVTGDIDLVAVTLANGSIPTAAERGDIFQNLQGILGIQHGDTLSWLQNGELVSQAKAKLLTNHLPGQEPLVVFDPAGAARAAFIQPEYTLFNATSQAGSVWYVGGYRTPLSSAYHFGQLAYPMFSSATNTVLQYLTPAGWVQQLQQQLSTSSPQSGVLPMHLAADSTPTIPSHALIGKCSWQYSRAADATLLYPNGNGGLQQWVHGAWHGLDLSSCGDTAAAPAHVYDLLPQTSLQSYAAAGATHLTLNGVDDVYPGADAATTAWFHVGDQVIISPGGSDQETATLVSLAPPTLNAPLQHEHSAGTMISVLPAAAAATGGFPVVLVVLAVLLALASAGIWMVATRRRRRRVPA